MGRATCGLLGSSNACRIEIEESRQVPLLRAQQANLPSECDNCNISVLVCSLALSALTCSNGF